jgi:hypothetical protein
MISAAPSAPASAGGKPCEVGVRGRDLILSRSGQRHIEALCVPDFNQKMYVGRRRQTSPTGLRARAVSFLPPQGRCRSCPGPPDRVVQGLLASGRARARRDGRSLRRRHLRSGLAPAAGLLVLRRARGGFRADWGAEVRAASSGVRHHHNLTTRTGRSSAARLFRRPGARPLARGIKPQSCRPGAGWRTQPSTARAWAAG